MAENVLVQRAEFVRDVETSAYGVVEKPLTTSEKIFNNAAVRKGILLVLLAAIWQVYASALENPLLFPKFSDTISAFYDNIKNGVLLQRGWFSIKVLLMGYVAGMFLASVLTALAITSRIGNDFLETLTAMFNPLPAIALLPLALIWFGLGNGSLVFVLIHSVLWPGRAQHAFRLPVRLADDAHGRAQLRAHRAALRDEDSDPGGVSEHPDGHEDRLGVRMAHVDRGRAGVRRVVGLGRSRLVHLREQEPARDRQRVCGTFLGNHHRPGGRELYFPQHRAENRAQVGNAKLGLRSKD
jgi:hypothetical protein